MCFYMNGKGGIPSPCAAHLNLILEIRTHLMALASISGKFTKEQVERRKVRLGKERRSHGDKEVPVYLRAQSLQGVLQARYRTKSLPYSPPAEIPLLARSPSRKTRETMYVLPEKAETVQNRPQKNNQNTRLAQTVEAKLTISSF